MQNRPFSRINHFLMMVAATLASHNNPAAMAAGMGMSRQEVINHLGGYQSNSKTGSKPQDNSGTRRFQRQALKKRNQQRHRRACRG